MLKHCRKESITAIIIIIKKEYIQLTGRGRGYISGGKKEGGCVDFYWGQVRIAAVSKCSFRAVLKEVRDLHSLTAFGRAFHIFVA